MPHELAVANAAAPSSSLPARTPVVSLPLQRQRRDTTPQYPRMITEAQFLRNALVLPPRKPVPQEWIPKKEARAAAHQQMIRRIQKDQAKHGIAIPKKPQQAGWIETIGGYLSKANQWLSFPSGAAAAAVTEEPLRVLLQRARDEGTKFYFDIDNELQEAYSRNPKEKARIDRMLKRTMDGFVQDFLNAAAEGSESERTMRQCFDKISAFVIFHPELSKQKTLNTFKPQESATYVPSENIIRIIASDRQAKLPRAGVVASAIHECRHVGEQALWEKQLDYQPQTAPIAPYSRQKIDQCKKALAHLPKQIANYLLYGTRAAVAADEMHKLARDYQHRPVLLSAQESDTLPITIDGHQMQMVFRKAILKPEAQQEHSLAKFVPYQISTLSNPQLHTPSEEEYGLMNAFMNLDRLQNLDLSAVAGMYKRGGQPPFWVNCEVRAAFGNLVPESVVDRYCSKGLFSAREQNKKPQSVKNEL